MTYRTKRPRTRSILAFGAGATLAITQLGAGCVPPDRYRDQNNADSGSEDGDAEPEGDAGDQ